MTHLTGPGADAARDASAIDAIGMSVDRIRRRLDAAGRPVPRTALLLGSGWAPLAARIAEPLVIGYGELPAFPQPAVEGHGAALVAGQLAGAEVLLLTGRKHAYEEGDAGAMKGAIRTLAALGVEQLLQTNAAGSLDPAMRPGELMLVVDHLNLPQRSPLFGEAGSSRFVDLRHAYDPALCAQARRAAAATGTRLHEGVYAWVMGPQFETPAEIRMLARLGAQAVGMSTVPETILARHAGLRVLAVSMLTNMACGLDAGTLSHAHTLAAAQGALPQALAWMENLVAGLTGA